MPFAEKKWTLVLSLALVPCLLAGCAGPRHAAPDPTPMPTPEPTVEIYRGEPEMDFTGVSYEELCEQLPQLTQLRKAHFAEDSLSAEQIGSIQTLRPDVELDYDFTVNGKPGSISFTRLDLRTADNAGMKNWLE